MLKRDNGNRRATAIDAAIAKHKDDVWPWGLLHAGGWIWYPQPLDE